MVLFSVPNFVPGPPPPFQHGPAFGAVRLSCQSCGYVALLEAERMGAVRPAQAMSGPLDFLPNDSSDCRLVQGRCYWYADLGIVISGGRRFGSSVSLLLCRNPLAVSGV